MIRVYKIMLVDMYDYIKIVLVLSVLTHAQSQTASQSPTDGSSAGVPSIVTSEILQVSSIYSTLVKSLTLTVCNKSGTKPWKRDWNRELPRKRLSLKYHTRQFRARTLPTIR